MTANDDPQRGRKRRRLEVARTLVGTALVAAMLAVVVTGFIALKEEKDAWLAMRIPLVLGVILTWSFTRIAKAIVSLGGESSA